MHPLMNEAELAHVHNFATFSLKTSLDQSTPEACKTFDVHYSLVTTDNGFRHNLLFDTGTWFKAGPTDSLAWLDTIQLGRTTTEVQIKSRSSVAYTLSPDRGGHIPRMRVWELQAWIADEG